MKPTDATPVAGGLVQKLLLVPGKHVVALYSRKLSLSIFRLQGVVGFNWQRKQLTLDYR